MLMLIPSVRVRSSCLFWVRLKHLFYQATMNFYVLKLRRIDCSFLRDCDEVCWVPTFAFLDSQVREGQGLQIIELLQSKENLIQLYSQMKVPIRQVELIDEIYSSKRSSLLTAQESSPKRRVGSGRRSRVQQMQEEDKKVEKDQMDKEKDEKDRGKKMKNKLQQRKFSWPIWTKLFQYTLRRKFMALLGMILSICSAVALGFMPLKVGLVLDQITTATQEQTQTSLNNLQEGVSGLIILVCCLAIFTYFRYITLQFLQQFLAMDMKNDFFSKFIKNDLYFFEQYKSGELVSRLSSDVNQAKSAVSNNLTFLIRHTFGIITNLVILFALNWKLAFLVILIVPLYSFITLQYSKRNKILVRESQDVQAEISAEVAQKFSGIQLIKAYSTEQKEIDNYKGIINKGYLINKKKLLLTGMFMACSQFLPYLGILIVLWYGGKMVLEGNSQLTAGELTSFIMYCNSLSSSTSSISNSYTNIINGTYAVQKVFQMLDYQPLVNQSEGSNIQISGDIQFRNVTFKYPTSKSPAIIDVSLKIKSGEYIAFVGQSGSGKSTMIKLIEKFYQIESGAIFYGTHNQDDINAVYLRKQIGLVNQDATMFSGTIMKNITYGLDDFNIQDVEEAAERAGCMQFLRDQKRFPKRFDSSVGEKGGNLSGGQKQRVSIARALLRKPKVIIFDEATSALDSNSERMVQTSIQQLAFNSHQDKPTIIVIAHRLSTVMNANRIVLMKAGRIMEVGSHRQLKALKGEYYRLIEKQLGDHPQLDSSPIRSSPQKKIHEQ